MEIQREASAYALPLQGIVHLESSEVSRGDRFAALTKCCAVRRGKPRQTTNILCHIYGGSVKSELRIENGELGGAMAASEELA